MLVLLNPEPRTLIIRSWISLPAADNEDWLHQPSLEARSEEIPMTPARKMLMETLVGHFALLQATYPRKAHTPLARKVQRYAKTTLKKWETPTRRMAA